MEQKHKVDQISDDLKEYVNLKIDMFKLQAVESLSTLFSKSVGFVIMTLLIGIGVVMFTCAITVLVAQLLGSMLWALVVMGVLFCLIGVAVYIGRDKMFTDSMVGMFSKMLFKERQHYDYDEKKEE